MYLLQYFSSNSATALKLRRSRIIKKCSGTGSLTCRPTGNSELVAGRIERSHGVHNEAKPTRSSIPISRLRSVMEGAARPHLPAAFVHQQIGQQAPAVGRRERDKAAYPLDPAQALHVIAATRPPMLKPTRLTRSSGANSSSMKAFNCRPACQDRPVRWRV